MPRAHDPNAPLIARFRRFVTGKGRGPKPTAEWFNSDEGRRAAQIYHASPIGRADEARATATFTSRNPHAARLLAFARTEEGRAHVERKGSQIERALDLFGELRRSDYADDAPGVALLGRMDVHAFMALEPLLRAHASKIRAKPNRRAARRVNRITFGTAALLIAWVEVKRVAPGRSFEEHVRRHASDREAKPIAIDGVELGGREDSYGVKGSKAPTRSGAITALKRHFTRGDIPTPAEQSAGLQHVEFRNEATSRRVRNIAAEGAERVARARRDQESDQFR